MGRHIGTCSFLVRTLITLVALLALACSRSPETNGSPAEASRVTATLTVSKPVHPESTAATLQVMESPDSALTRELLGSEIQQTTLRVDDFIFDGLTSGPVDGIPVMLLHGFPSTAYQWRSQLVTLGDAGYRVFAPNQRGYSSKARPEEAENYTYNLLIEDVIAMADALAWEKFHLIGHDWGAFIAWATAGFHPSRILSLTPISVPHPEAFAQALANPSGEQSEMSSYVTFFRSEGSEDVLLSNDAEILRDLYASANLTDLEMEPYLEVLGTPDALRAALHWYRVNNFAGVTSILKSNRLTDIPDSPVATMFIWSDQDTALGREGAELTGVYVTGEYRFEILHDVNHWVTEVAAQPLNALLLEHLATYSQ